MAETTNPALDLKLSSWKTRFLMEYYGMDFEELKTAITTEWETGVPMQPNKKPQQTPMQKIIILTPVGYTNNAKQRAFGLLSGHSYSAWINTVGLHFEIHVCDTKAALDEVKFDKDVKIMMYLQGRRVDAGLAKLLVLATEKLATVEGLDPNTGIDLLE